MRTFQVVADGTPGGGTTNVLALTEDLLEANVQVIFCSQKGSYAIEQAKRLGAEIVDGIDFFRSRIDGQVVSDLSAEIAARDPEIVHVHGGRAALAWVRAGDQSRLQRTLYTVRGYHFYRKPFPVQWFAKRAERKISRSVFRTIHVCQDDQDSALEFGLIKSERQSQVIRNGIRLSDIPIPEMMGDRKHVIVMGRLVYQKAPHLILDIAKELSEEGFVFNLVGGGEMESEIRQRVDEESLTNVILHGAKPRSEALQIMAKSGTFLLASRWEGLPIAPVEAMAMGLAVVISDVNGNTEVVRDEVDGRVSPSEDQHAFAQRLRAVVSEPDSTIKYIANGRKRVVEHFTRQRVVAQHLDLYRECRSCD